MTPNAWEAQIARDIALATAGMTDRNEVARVAADVRRAWNAKSARFRFDPLVVKAS